jgi:hypothetical protein
MVAQPASRSIRNQQPRADLAEFAQQDTLRVAFRDQNKPLHTFATLVECHIQCNVSRD